MTAGAELPVIRHRGAFWAERRRVHSCRRSGCVRTAPGIQQCCARTNPLAHGTRLGCRPLPDASRHLLFPEPSASLRLEWRRIHPAAVPEPFEELTDRLERRRHRIPLEFYASARGIHDRQAQREVDQRWAGRYEVKIPCGGNRGPDRRQGKLERPCAEEVTEGACPSRRRPPLAWLATSTAVRAIHALRALLA
jgi:hypothetical protein